jgi:putative ABC transport system permease protein
MRWPRRNSREHDLERELRDHLDLEAEEQRESGLPSGQAAHAARRAFGNPTLIKEQIRELSPFNWLEALKQDVRYGARMLKNSPGFTAVAVCTLALGIGANTAIFSVVNAVLLNPLPYPDSARLVMLWEQKPALGWVRNIVSAANFVDWKRQNHVFAGMAALSESTFNLSGTGEPVELRGAQVSADFFPVLGVRPALGRIFTPEDDRLEDSRVVILTHQLWQERYGADPALIGRQITVNRRQFTVIGVLPPEFYFPPWKDDTQRAQLWVTGLDLRNTQRTWHAYESIGRLKPGVTFEQAQAEMDTISRRLAAQYPEQKGWAAQLIDLHDQVVGDTRPALLVLLAAVGVVLLIACANLANLQLARLAARQREIAVRAALGGGRFRVIRQLLTESVLLALAGGVLGAALAAWGVKLFVALGPRNTPGLQNASVNFNVLWFTLALSVLTGVVFGLLPAFDASHIDLIRSFKEGGRSLTHGLRTRRLRGVLVCTEFALALILLTGAGLLIRSFAALSRVELGFDPHHAMTVRVALQGQAYIAPSRQIQFFKNLLPAVQSLPGVTAVGAVDGGGLPPIGGSGQDFLIENRPIPPMSDWPDGSVRVVSPDYFRATGIRLARGRFLTDADNETAPRVAVINERLARDYWPGRDPIGSRVRFPGLAIKFPELPDEPRWLTIVGVVKDVKNRGPQVPAIEEIYISYQQPPAFYTPRALVVRSAGDPAALTPAIRRLVQALDPNQPISQVRTLDEIVALAEAGRRFPMLLLGLFAALALLLAGIGIYGVMSYSITQRTHEIGIRMALGARSRDVVASTLAEAMRLAVIGVALGLAGSLALTRLVSGLLFGVGARDPLTLLTVSLLLLAIAMAAVLIPARRASRVDPIVTLRYE